MTVQVKAETYVQPAAGEATTPGGTPGGGTTTSPAARGGKTGSQSKTGKS